MRSSSLFLAWLLLASTASSLSTPDRWFDLELRDEWVGLVNGNICADS
jgi:hypothetical protein